VIETKRLDMESAHERYPFFCQWELTSRCNLHCVMCYSDCFNRPDKIRQELSTPEVLGILDELGQAGCMELCLTGGEPLMRPDFWEIFSYAKKSGFLIHLFTNGTLIDETVADRFAGLPPHRVEITLHSLNSETFDGITKQRGSYEKCVQAIHLLQERKIPLVLKTVIMTLNQNEALPLKSHFRSLKDAAFTMSRDIFPALDGSQTPRQYEITEDAWTALLETDSELKAAAEQFACDDKICRGGRYKFFIDAYGGLKLCSGNRRKSYDLRSGCFREGFYRRLPYFPCPLKPGCEYRECAQAQEDPDHG